MPAFLMPGGNKRIVVDRIFNLGEGRHLCELQGQFFSMDGQFVEDEELVGLLPEPHRARALKFVAGYKAAKMREEAQGTANLPPREEEIREHIMSEELRAVLDVRTSEERAQAAD